MRVTRTIVAAAVLALAAPAAAQTRAAVPPTAAAPMAAQMTAEQRDKRFQISQLERLLEGAVEHGLTLFRQRLQAALPSQLLITPPAPSIIGISGSTS